MKRATIILLSVASACICLYYFHIWQMLGFPDGHRTPLEHAHRIAYPFFCFVFFLNSALTMNQLHREERTRLMLIIFAILISALLMYHLLSAAFLVHGGGG